MLFIIVESNRTDHGPMDGLYNIAKHRRLNFIIP